MSKHTRNKVSYNVDEALDYLQESGEEDFGQLEDDNEGDSSTDSKYNDADNLVSIATNVSIPGVDQDAQQVEFVVQEERPKCKRNIGPIMSLDTSLDETNYDAFFIYLFIYLFIFIYFIQSRGFFIRSLPYGS